MVGRTKVLAIPPSIPCVLLFSVWIIDVVHMFGGEISKEFGIGDVRDLPHTYSCTCLYSKENKSGNKRDSAWVEYRGVKTLLNQRMLLFGALKFLFYFILYFYFMLLYIFLMAS